MQFQVSSKMTYGFGAPSTMFIGTHALRTANQQVNSETFTLDPTQKYEEFLSETGENRFVRIVVGSGVPQMTMSYQATVTTDPQTVPTSELNSASPSNFDRERIRFLYPSRYCQSDMLARFVRKEFGGIQGPYAQALAVTDWIFHNVDYLSGATNASTSAYDTITQRAGVCRDFAHLGVALCRALSLPARYAAVYSYQLDPMDFHAVYEVWIAGRWVLFDATRLAPLNGFVRIATGRDAADASMATIFGPAWLMNQTVDCQLAEGQNFQPVTRPQLDETAVCLG